eukprot:CAMPEP_0171238320 /NCGR_PEP_ID=MMETSP0790-20130122/43413_1 /TAXON_ID=2925 /ORGANISM="Alexandrium catenella, Strain OF101" /LENGTH=152 /DNA_ID=CAMNT_0011704683 /DNA_START=55 /DNA_END=513 /DNA_ORIENTATION=+
MKPVTAVLLVCLASAANGSIHLRQPIYEGKVDSDTNFAVSAQDSKPARMPGYRAAWDDCGGSGASATERMRGIAAKIKGWAKPLPFMRHAAQDCGAKDKTGTVPGPNSRVNYPGPEVPAAAREGLQKAEDTLAKYPAEVKPAAEHVGHLYHD